MKTLLLGLILFPAFLHAKEPGSLNGMTKPEVKIVREWKSDDGKSLQAELLEYSETEIKVNTSKNFKIVRIPMERLSQEDRDFVMAMVKKNSLDYSLTDGKFATQMVEGEFTKNVSEKGLKYQIKGNPKWDGKKRYPLLVWLHGAGQSGDDNTSQAAGSPRQLYNEEAQKKQPFFMLMPQCPDRAIGWKNEVADNLMALITDLSDNLPIDKDRIYLTGSSMGGAGTWGMIAKWPDVFACAVPLCGGGDASKAETMKGVPIWIFHGDKDDSVPVEASRKMYAAMQGVKGNVQYTELPGAGHIITDQVYGKPELGEWIFAQKRIPVAGKKR
ncbi:prolyl oligopeptidase family serine peptidase [Luteolibacter sp. SL250]|uniref:carboxylesterase family protein n=1 Tax=Luteolibacter sp. SL250 TaxID=2995170 RepID=UPI00226FDA80|nr:prolyl oligopeptidase family serine peptidase [Luteolibacter sp. SL250]WAC17878.1 prolyl oligopeptidase family serine peptidase [Luteolibacter sp. SL250]